MILAVLLTVLLAAVLFLKLNPIFGGSPSKEERADYASRASNYVDGKFAYPAEYELDGLSEDRRISQKGTTPKEELPIADLTIPENPAADQVYVTWLGHSSLLIQMHGLNILVDPLYSDRASPLPFVGPQRFSQAPVSVEALPKIDIVLLSHDHYDHLDMNAIRALDDKVERYIVPLGVENHLERFGVEADKISNMAWWEEISVDGLTVACTPARHYSSRMFLDAGKTLYASWVLKDEYHQIYQSGDSGYGGHFAAIHEKYGDFDFVMTDCSQYDLKWHTIHMLPEEAVDACTILGAELAMPIHWGAYVLSNHAWDDPVERFSIAAEQAGLEIVTPMLGETMNIDQYADYQQQWWKDID